ncbi:hypothetical protein B0T12DRAFT_424484 [Alternaria alternata]|nr:hypothetical protein B0T12DRAFT_424484 [Alternaria alternata]
MQQLCITCLPAVDGMKPAAVPAPPITSPAWSLAPCLTLARPRPPLGAASTATLFNGLAR